VALCPSLLGPSELAPVVGQTQGAVEDGAVIWFIDLPRREPAEPEAVIISGALVGQVFKKSLREEKNKAHNRGAPRRWRRRCAIFALLRTKVDPREQSCPAPFSSIGNSGRVEAITLRLSTVVCKSKRSGCVR
jgi:hypothetical protein